jgi:hypothetical protein
MGKRRCVTRIYRLDVAWLWGTFEVVCCEWSSASLNGLDWACNGLDCFDVWISWLDVVFG